MQQTNKQTAVAFRKRKEQHDLSLREERAKRAARVEKGLCDEGERKEIMAPPSSSRLVRVHCQEYA